MQISYITQVIHWTLELCKINVSMLVNLNRPKKNLRILPHQNEEEKNINSKYNNHEKMYYLVVLHDITINNLFHVFFKNTISWCIAYESRTIVNTYCFCTWVVL